MLPTIPRLSMCLCLTLGLSSSVHAVLPQQINGHVLPSLAPMLKKVMPAVVTIAAEGSTSALDLQLDEKLLRRFYGVPMPTPRRTQSLGSGVIVDAKKGLVLTNNHVVTKAAKITVVLHDGRKLEAKTIGTDKDSDLAVIQIKADNLHQIAFGNSDRLEVGDFVVAIGNPFALGHSATSGIISGLGRSGLGSVGYEDFIQTDASINTGNSGGALVNLRGELIGINTLIITDSDDSNQPRGNIGIGFAIPINMANKVLTQILTYGEVRRGLLGVNIQNLTPELARYFKLHSTDGALVASVIPKSAAELAGLRAGDVVVEVDNKPIKNANALRNTIGLMNIRQSIKLTYWRDGRRLSSKAQLGSLLAQTQAKTQTQPTRVASVHKHLEGAHMSEIPNDSPYYGKINGVIVSQVEPNSAAANNGLSPGDLITTVNEVPVKNTAEFSKALAKHKNKVLLNVQRGDTALYIYLE